MNLSPESLRLIKRSSELITQITFGNVKEIEEHEEALNLATCAQIEYWLELSESISIIDGIKSISLGKFSIQFVESNNKLSSRAKSYLSHLGLLYRGV